MDARTPPRTLPFWSAHQLWAMVGAALACVAAISGAFILEYDGHHRASLVTLLGAGGIALLFFVRSWQLDRAMRRDLRDLRLKYDGVYERAAIAIWQEDWSAVAEAIERLHGLGVSDIAGWYAARPEEARALHAKVLITGVNDYSVEQMRARSKAQLLGSLAEVLPGSHAAFGRWLDAFARGARVYVGESVIQRCDGSCYDCFVTASLPRRAEDYRDIIVCVVDVSAYKQDQQRLAEAREGLARSQRIATVGALTASIAHEVNSPLAAISTSAAASLRWLRRDRPDLDEAEAAVSAVLIEAERARAVIDRTRSYLAKAERRREPINLRALVLESALLVEREAQTHEISVSVAVGDDLGTITGDRIQLQQVLVNLLVNAIQAMSEARHPRQLILTAGRQANGVSIEVEDTGPGIPVDQLDQIFEPFYSTKQGGMGMGLAICRTSIDLHGGTLSARSRPEEGSCFRVFLPVEAR